MAATKKGLLVKVTAANGDGAYLINPSKIILVCPAVTKNEDGTFTTATGTHVFLEEGNGRHVLEPVEFFEQFTR